MNEAIIVRKSSFVKVLIFINSIVLLLTLVVFDVFGLAMAHDVYGVDTYPGYANFFGWVAQNLATPIIVTTFILAVSNIVYYFVYSRKDINKFRNFIRFFCFTTAFTSAAFVIMSFVGFSDQ